MGDGNVTADDVAVAIASILGDESVPGITSTTTLEGDLGLDSVDVTALGAELRSRYGADVDLGRHVAGLDIDEVIGLTVGGVADYVNSLLDSREPR
jgi:acyl carrier protein